MEIHAIVDAWLRRGRPEPRPAEVTEHLEGCLPCARALAESDRVRGWFLALERLGPPAVSEAASSSIRFHLQSIARLSQRPRAGVHWSAAPSRRRVALLGAALIGIGGVLAAGELIERKLVEPVGAPRSLPAELEGTRAAAIANVETLWGRAARHLRDLPDEAYALDHGGARFTVPKLRGGARISVRVGGDLVVVHGTRFRVEAVMGRLQSVDVAEGVVSLELDGGPTVQLRAGQRWKRNEPARFGSGEAEPGWDEVEPSAAERGQATRPHRRAAERRTPRPRARSTTPDAAFSAAWRLYRDGRFDAASLAFDALLESDLSDLGERRADVLFWSAEAHRGAGRPERALERCEELLGNYPGAWRADDARALREELRAARQAHQRALGSVQEPPQPGNIDSR